MNSITKLFRNVYRVSGINTWQVGEAWVQSQARLWCENPRFYNNKSGYAWVNLGVMESRGQNPWRLIGLHRY